jgi:uncharacterized protein (TIGR03083 family)
MTTVTQSDVRRPRLDRRVAMQLARTEYGRFTEALDALRPTDWALSTDCPGWDVRAMASHVLGMAAMAASVREGGRQRKLAGRGGGVFLDELTSLQVRERVDLAGPEIAKQMARISPKAARGRRLAPWFIRRRRLPVLQYIDGVAEAWTIGFVNDVILTRDTWMHRVDISRATGQPLVLTPEHDGVLVADVVEEWADRHGAAFELTLTGPAGGSWTGGEGGEVITVDAVEFCRALSGRAPQPGLLRSSVPF